MGCASKTCKFSGKNSPTAFPDFGYGADFCLSDFVKHFFTVPGKNLCSRLKAR